jgi:hypothetical protein
MTSVLQKNITRSKQNIPHLLTSDIDGFLLKKNNLMLNFKKKILWLGWVQKKIF